MRRFLLICLLLVPALASAQFFGVYSGSVGPGFEITDHALGYSFKLPNNQWFINANDKRVSLNHRVYHDAFVSLQKSWAQSRDLQKSYDKRKASIQKHLPEASFIDDAVAITVSGQPALRMIYEDPISQKYIFEASFLLDKDVYVLTGSSKKRTFRKLRDDFDKMVAGIVLIKKD